MRKRVPLIRQTTQTECGLCCAATVLSYFGYAQPISFYRKKYKIGRDGISLYQLNDILVENHITPEIYQIVDWENHCFSKNDLYIFFCKNAHFVVVRSSTKSGYLEMYDPAQGKKIISTEEISMLVTDLCMVCKPNSHFKKCRKTTSDYRHLFPILRTKLPFIFFISVISIASFLVSLQLPLLMQNIINAAIYSQTSTDIVSIVFQLLGIALLYYMISSIRNHFTVKLNLYFREQISLKTVLHLFRIPFSFFDNRSHGNILFRLNIMESIQSSLTSFFTTSAVSLSAIVAILLYFCALDLSMMLKSLISLIVLCVIICFINSHILKVRRAEMTQKEKLQSLLTEIVNNMYQIRTMHIGSILYSNYNSFFEQHKIRYKKAEIETQNSNLLINIAYTVTPIAIILSYWVEKGFNFPVGNIFALYSMLTTLFSQGLSFITGCSSIVLMRNQLFYFNDLLDEQPSLPNGKTNISTIQSISLRDVDFRYSQTSPWVLKKISLDIVKGQKVAIVGASGCGKTTLVKLLSNLYAPTSGTIQINDITLDNISEESIEKLFAFVPQSPVIFNKSVRENIDIENVGLSDQEIYEALQLANIAQDICNSPMALNTIIASQGSNLSGGQLQRIAIARVLAKNPEVVVFDEATSSLDVHNEIKICQNLKEKHFTQIVITHRIFSIIDADKIIMLEDGNIIGTGTHDELLNNCKSYRKMCEEQCIN